MTTYVCLVVVQYSKATEKQLFFAPAWSNIQPGDQVILGKGATSPATVISAMTCSTESKEFKFAVESMGAELPLKKLKSKLVYEEFRYEEYEEDEANE